MPDCWMVCEDNWEIARERGFDELSSILRGILGNASVSDRLSREELRERIRRGGSRKDTLVIVGHRTDLRKVATDLSKLGTIDGLTLVELQFTTATVGDDAEGGFAHDGLVPYCSIPFILGVISGASGDEFSSQERLNEWFSKRRAETQRSIMDPLLPLAVLVDGFLACPTASHEWFKLGLDAAVSASGPSGVTVGTDEYWQELHGNKAAVERIQKAVKSTTGKLPRGCTAVLVAARELGWTGGELDSSVEANELYRNACEAVKVAWQRLKSDEETSHGEETFGQVIKDASVGFHVLAVGFL